MLRAITRPAAPATNTQVVTAQPTVGARQASGGEDQAEPSSDIVTMWAEAPGPPGRPSAQPLNRHIGGRGHTQSHGGFISGTWDFSTSVLKPLNSLSPLRVQGTRQRCRLSWEVHSPGSERYGQVSGTFLGRARPWTVLL